MPGLPLLFTLALGTPSIGDPALEAKARAVLDEWCTACHAAGGSLDDASEFPLAAWW